MCIYMDTYDHGLDVGRGKIFSSHLHLNLLSTHITAFTAF